MNAPTTLTYRVADMSCAHCEAAIGDALGRVDGVRAVDVDLGSKLVRVSGAGVDPAAAVQAIDEAGYAAEPA